MRRQTTRAQSAADGAESSGVVAHGTIVCSGEAIAVAANHELLLDVGRFFDPRLVHALVSVLGAEWHEGGGAGGLLLVDDPSAEDVRARVDGESVTVEGPLLARLDADPPEWSLFGHLGFALRYVLYVLELRRTLTLHAAAVYRRRDETAFVVLGASGTGKTIALLDAVRGGYEVVATDLVHLSVRDDGVHLHRGAYVDNVWPGLLETSFSDVARSLGAVMQPNHSYAAKTPLDLSSVFVAEQRLTDRALIFVLPRLRPEPRGVRVAEIGDPRAARLALFQSASEKLLQPSPLFGSAAPVLATSELAAWRWDTVAEVLRRAGGRVVRVDGGAHDVFAAL